jgi:threonine/homoserine/homoserine lactone efflux protein
VDGHRFALLAGAHFLALLSPGPDFFLIVRYALVQGAGAAALASVGIALANGVFIVAAISGFTLLRDQPLAYALLYWSGCAYLAWLGLRFWQAGKVAALSSATDRPAPLAARVSSLGLLVSGFLSGILNPKNALFYLALFTLMVGRNTAPLWQTVCGLWMFCAVLAWDWAVSWAAGHPRVMRQFSRQLSLVHRSSGVLLWTIALGMLYHGS